MADDHPLSAQCFRDVGFELGVDPAYACWFRRASGLHVRAVREPVGDDAATGGHREGRDRGGVEDVDLILRPGEGDVEHPLDMGEVALTSG